MRRGERPGLCDTMQEMEELKLVMEGLKDVEEGRVVDGPTAMAEIRREYGL